MKVRICSKCKVNAPRNKTSCYCKFCHNEYQKAYYKKNPRAQDAWSKQRSMEIRSLVIKAKDVPCTDCGNKFPYYIMDLDHLGDKKFNLSEAKSHNWAIDTVKREIEKCEAVCANCHRERTFSRMRSCVIGSTQGLGP